MLSMSAAGSRSFSSRMSSTTHAGARRLRGLAPGGRADHIGGIQALTAWRLYNKGAVVEQRIEELAQLSADRIVVDDTDGNALLWSLAVVAYQTLHTLREHFLSGSWRTAQPKRLRNWLVRLPAKLATHARKDYLQFLRGEPARSRLLTRFAATEPRHLASSACLSFRPPTPCGSPTATPAPESPARTDHPSFPLLSALVRPVLLLTLRHATPSACRTLRCVTKWLKSGRRAGSGLKNPRAHIAIVRSSPR